MTNLKLGFLINPLAGTGGPLANKGSDNLRLSDHVDADTTLNAHRRALTFLQGLKACAECIHIISVPGLMGGDVLTQGDFPVNLKVDLITFQPPPETSALDTQLAAREIMSRGVDLFIFVGGDGTARDICALVSAEFSSQLVLGVPAGVKMHSSVYAVNPQAAAEVVCALGRLELLNVHMAEVRDIDEMAFRLGQVKSRHYGEMLTPFDGRFIQQVKQGGFEVEELLLLDIADYLTQLWDEKTLIIFGPGSTLFNIQTHLGLPATLLGFDVVKAGEILHSDATHYQLQKCIQSHQGKILVFITAIGRQGHIIGRGNQQLSADILRVIGKSAVHIVATKAKLTSLEGRCLFMDSGDPLLDAQWQGFMPVICGYQETVLYPLGVSI